MVDLAARVEELARRVLDASWREGEQAGRRYAFTAPSPTRYPWQWYWDSCFIAIVRSRWDRERARRELESLLAVSEDGFIGHIAFWGRPLDLERAASPPPRRRWWRGCGTSGPAASSTRPGARSTVRCRPSGSRSPGTRWRRWPSPTCRRRSAAAWSRRRCSPSASGRACPSPAWRSPTPPTPRATTTGGCAAP